MNIVDVKHIKKNFDGKPALRDISLRLEAGKSYAAVGANGSGKTTSLRILAGLLSADGGEGHILGTPLSHPLFSLRAQVGYMTQHYSLYREFTVEENLRARAQIYGIAQPQSAVTSILNEFGLTEVIKKKVGLLSGGFMRRVQFASTLLHQPALLLLDEPTAGLDMDSKQHLWEQIDRLTNLGKTIIVSTHDLEDTAACDVIGVFVEGRIVAQGNAQELIKASRAMVWHISAKNRSVNYFQQHIHDMIFLRKSGEDYYFVFNQQPEKTSRVWFKQQGYVPQEIAPTFTDAIAVLTRPIQNFGSSNSIN